MHVETTVYLRRQRKGGKKGLRRRKKNLSLSRLSKLAELASSRRIYAGGEDRGGGKRKEGS